MVNSSDVTAVDLISVITSSTSVVLAFGAVFAFYTQKNKEAEARGKLMNRVDRVEKDVSSCTDGLDQVMANHMVNAQSLAKQEAAIEYIKQKIDDMARWYSDMAKTMNEIAQRMPYEDRRK